MQAVILAGGLGTRLADVTGGLPKPMVDVGGRPFLEYEMALLRQHGVRDIILCVGHMADKVQDYLDDGRRFGVSIRYSVERGSLLGTAGAVKQAEPLLNDLFFLTYADSYLEMDYETAFKDMHCRTQLAMMVVFRNENRYDRSNVVIKDGLVKAYDKQNRVPGMDYINFGVSVLRKESLALVPKALRYSQEDWFQELIGNNDLAAFETKERFYEVGSPDGLAEFRRLVAEGTLP